ncbi:MAG: response regulator transcription factor [Actinomycetia bacterium]|nr:response regulator transcription factor [Actinomycetes bacterium]
MKKILIIDDDPEIRNLVSDFLSKENMNTDSAENGTVGMDLLSKNTDYDLVILDIMLPDISGTEICKKIRESSSVPIIMLTARNEDIDKILGLEIGADDYLTKPFNPRELVARIKAVFRRKELDRSHTGTNILKLRLGKKDIKIKEEIVLEIDLNSRIVLAGGKEIRLTNREYQLLVYLTDNKGIVISRDSLLQNIWGFDFYGQSRTIDVHIKQLRKKLGDPQGIFIETIWSAGYRLNFLNE